MSRGGGASPWRSSSAGPSPAAAIVRSPVSTAPARCRPSSRKISIICIKPLELPRNTSSNCTAIRPSPYVSTATRATNCPGCAREWTLRTAARQIALPAAASSRLRPSRSVRRCPMLQCGVPRNLPRTAICSWRLAPRWWSGRLPAFPLMAKSNGARLVIVNREPTEFDEIADLVVHAGYRDRSRTPHCAVNKFPFVHRP